MMDCNGTAYEKTIDLAALIASVVRRWKWILAAAVIFALLLGGYEYLRPATVTVDQNQLKNTQTAIDADQASLATNLADFQTNKTNILANARMIEENEAFLEVSEASRAAMTRSLETLQGSLDRAQGILDDPGTSAEQAAEIYSQLPALTTGLADTETKLTELSQQMGSAENNITLWRSQIGAMTGTSAELLAAGRELAKRIADQQWNLAVQKAGTPQPKSVMRKAVMGGMLGAVLCVAFILLQAVLDRKLRAGEDLHDAFHLPVLGEFYSARAQKHKKFNKALDRFEGDIQTLPEADDIYGLVCAGIVANTQGPLRLAVTGTTRKQTLEDLAERLRALLPPEYEVTAQENPVYNAGFLTHIKEYSVLLTEEKGVSDKREITRLMELLGHYRVTVIGAVVK